MIVPQLRRYCGRIGSTVTCAETERCPECGCKAFNHPPLEDQGQCHNFVDYENSKGGYACEKRTGHEGVCGT